MQLLILDGLVTAGNQPCRSEISGGDRRRRAARGEAVFYQGKPFVATFTRKPAASTSLSREIIRPPPFVCGRIWRAAGRIGRDRRARPNAAIPPAQPIPDWPEQLTFPHCVANRQRRLISQCAAERADCLRVPDRDLPLVNVAVLVRVGNTWSGRIRPGWPA